MVWAMLDHEAKHVSRESASRAPAMADSAESVADAQPLGATTIGSRSAFAETSIDDSAESEPSAEGTSAAAAVAAPASCMGTIDDSAESEPSAVVPTGAATELSATCNPGSCTPDAITGSDANSGRSLLDQLIDRVEEAEVAQVE